MTRTRLAVLLALAVFGAGVPTAHAAENPLAAALTRSAAQPRVQILLTGRCGDLRGKKARCSVRLQSDRAAAYHYYRAFIAGMSFRVLGSAGRSYVDTGFLNLISATPGEDDEKLPVCWISEERAREPDLEGLEVDATSTGEAFRELRRDLRGGTITRAGRTITRVKGDERARFELDTQGRVTGAVVENKQDGRYRMTVTYPDVPFRQMTPAPECTDEQLEGDDR